MVLRLLSPPPWFENMGILLQHISPRSRAFQACLLQSSPTSTSTSLPLSPSVFQPLLLSRPHHKPRFPLHARMFLDLHPPIRVGMSLPRLSRQGIGFPLARQGFLGI